jgi:hypothetical protein
MDTHLKVSLVCIVLGVAFAVSDPNIVSAYRIDGSSWDSRNLATNEWGESDAQAQWHGSDGADLDAYSEDEGSGCYASARWTYNLGSTSGTVTIKWCYHVRAEFSVRGDGLSYCSFWFELWDSTGKVGSSSTNVHQSDINSDKTISKTFNSLPSDSYEVTVYSVADAETESEGSTAEADAYYGPLEVETNWVDVN